MKHIIQEHLKAALAHYPELLDTPITIEYARLSKHGDFSSSIALSLAQHLKISPYVLAKKIAHTLQSNKSLAEKLFEKIEVIQPGFINFFIRKKAWHPILSEILQKSSGYGNTNIGKGESILVEFVSSNPTGPLHIGHGRAAAHGDIVVRLLKALGYQVHAEYYVNDAGRQIDILSCSVWLRYLEDCGENIDFPPNAYQGNYIRLIATAVQSAYHRQFYYSSNDIRINLTANTTDKEQLIDALIEKAKSILGEKAYQQLTTFTLNNILQDIKSDLSEFGVCFDTWFSEKKLIEDNSVFALIKLLSKKGYTYQLQGNLWFKSTQFGDDKDRVLLRKNGQPTYFAVDAAYRLDIFQKRKFTKIINILGADHHGYLARIHAVIQALGYQSHELVFMTLQFVSLSRENQKLPLSTRQGEFITLRQLRTEVGNDAARVFFILRQSGQTIDFDLTLAKSQSHQNPIYYLQYAYARICSITRQLLAKKLTWSLEDSLNCLSSLTLEEEINLIKQLSRYPEIILQAGTQYEPYLLLQYLRELAKSFHSYYNHTYLLVEEDDIRNARLALIGAIKQVLSNGFFILGITPLEFM